MALNDINLKDLLGALRGKKDDASPQDPYTAVPGVSIGTKRVNNIPLIITLCIFSFVIGLLAYTALERAERQGAVLQEEKKQPRDGRAAMSMANDIAGTHTGEIIPADKKPEPSVQPQPIPQSEPSPAFSDNPGALSSFDPYAEERLRLREARMKLRFRSRRIVNPGQRVMKSTLVLRKAASDSQAWVTIQRLPISELPKSVMLTVALGQKRCIGLPLVAKMILPSLNAPPHGLLSHK